MIILYAITGCVTLLFLIVITSGAVRAMRHPERYGPRAAGWAHPGDGGQSRATGLAKAVLDTIPVVKFFSGSGGASAPSSAAQNQAQGVQTDTEAGHGLPKDGVEQNQQEEAIHGRVTAADVPMRPIRVSQDSMVKNLDTPMEGSHHTLENGHGQEASESDTLAPTVAQSHQHERSGTQTTIVEGANDNVTSASEELTSSSVPVPVPGPDPADVNDSITCPICLVDFEDGDDIRILPCDSRHRFHDEVRFLSGFRTV